MNREIWKQSEQFIGVYVFLSIGGNLLLKRGRLAQSPIRKHIGRFHHSRRSRSRRERGEITSSLTHDLCVGPPKKNVMVPTQKNATAALAPDTRPTHVYVANIQVVETRVHNIRYPRTNFIFHILNANGGNKRLEFWRESHGGWARMRQKRELATKTNVTTTSSLRK